MLNIIRNYMLDILLDEVLQSHPTAQLQTPRRGEVVLSYPTAPPQVSGDMKFPKVLKQGLK